jgi:hypothetical protein
MGRFITSGSMGPVPRYSFVLDKFIFEGEEREAATGDLVLASSGANARRLLGEAVFIVL